MALEAVALISRRAESPGRLAGSVRHGPTCPDGRAEPVDLHPSARRSTAEADCLVGYLAGCDAKDLTWHLADGRAVFVEVRVRLA